MMFAAKDQSETTSLLFLSLKSCVYSILPNPTTDGSHLIALGNRILSLATVSKSYCKFFDIKHDNLKGINLLKQVF